MAGSRRYFALDGLRGVAALVVAVYHYGQASRQYAHGGYLAVDLFFALSGFVIALNYHERIRSGLGLARFFTIRLIRLYPIYLSGALLGAAIYVGRSVAAGREAELAGSHGVELALVFAASLAMLPAPAGLGTFEPVLFPLNGPSWSLLLEILVNIAFAAWLAHMRSRWLVMLCAFAAAWLAARIGAPDYFNVGWAWGNVDQGLARALFSFPVGILLWRHMPLEKRKASWCAAALIGLAVTVMCLRIDAEHRSTYELAVVLVLFPALLAGLILAELPSRLKGTATFLGDISYAVYALHFPLAVVFARRMAAMELHPAAGAALFITSIIFAAYLCTTFYDRTMRNWLNARLWRRTAA